MKGAGLLGWLIFGVSTVYCVATYGKHWDLSGKYHMPTALLSPDGKTYRDGSEVDPVTLALVRQGIEQEAMLGAVGTLVALFAVWVVKTRRAQRRQREAFEHELRRMQGTWRKDGGK